MSSRPRYHSRDGWAWDRGMSRSTAGALARLRGPRYPQYERRDAWWQCPPPRGWVWRTQPRRSDRPPPGPWFQRPPRPRQWPPYCWGDPRRGNHPHRFPPRARPWDWKSRAMPRRGPPVAALRVPRWYWFEEGERGSLAGSNCEAICGESRKVSQGNTDPIPKTSQHQPTRKENGKNKEDKKTHDRHRQEEWEDKEIGPLSRTAAWRAG